IDLDGAPRLQGDNIDMGVYEVDPSTITIPGCATITAPADGSEDATLNMEITWSAAERASAYRIFIGTTPGATDIVDGEEVTGTIFTPVTDWDEGTTYFVTVVPYNAAGEATGCAEISFTTTTLLAAPECTTITNPGGGNTDVSLGAGIVWTAADGANGYRIYIGTNAGGTDIVNGEETTGTTFSLVGGWAENTAYYVTVVPFNDAGEAVGCAEISFTTETPLTAPACAVITGPAAGAEDVALDAVITWGAVTAADGYRVFVGTAAGGTDVADGEEVARKAVAQGGGGAQSTTHSMNVVQFNGGEEGAGCAEIR